MLSKLNILNIPFESLLNWLTISLNDLSVIAFLVFFIVLVSLEIKFPKVAIPLPVWRQSYRANISLFIFNSTVLSLLAVPSLVVLADQYADQGLLNTLSPTVWKTVLAFLLLDMILYLWHKACHSFDLLWEFHKVHHCDPDLNVSTAFRVHIIEVMIGIVIKAAYIITLGVDKMTVITYEFIITFFVMLHHANFSLPGEHILGRIFIVPSLHRVHHSKRREEHDQNYGSVLSIWDWLFGTLVKLEPESIGIKGNPPLDFINLVKFGFLPSAQQPVAEPNLKSMIADAAYFKALNRGFSKDHELEDWLQAEQDIMYRHKSPKKGFKQFLNKIQFPLFSIYPMKCAYTADTV